MHLYFDHHLVVVEEEDVGLGLEVGSRLAAVGQGEGRRGNLVDLVAKKQLLACITIQRSEMT